MYNLIVFFLYTHFLTILKKMLIRLFLFSDDRCEKEHLRLGDQPVRHPNRARRKPGHVQFRTRVRRSGVRRRPKAGRRGRTGTKPDPFY